MSLKINQTQKKTIFDERRKIEIKRLQVFLPIVQKEIIEGKMLKILMNKNRRE